MEKMPIPLDATGIHSPSARGNVPLNKSSVATMAHMVKKIEEKMGVRDKDILAMKSGDLNCGR